MCPNCQSSDTYIATDGDREFYLVCSNCNTTLCPLNPIITDELSQKLEENLRDVSKLFQ